MRAKLLCVLLVVLLGVSVNGFAADSPSLWNVVKELQSKKFVDLTHAFFPGIPHWPGFDNEAREISYHYDKGKGTKGAGFLAHTYRIPGQWGTHCDPPAHFARGKRLIDEISVKEMVLPLVVIDCSAQVKKNPDYTVTMDDVKAWEKKYGKIPANSFVAMRSDWSKRWPSPEKMRNEDAKKVAHYPGWSMEVLKYLYEDCKITASGHEPTDTDPGTSTSKGSYACEAYVLGQDKYQIELLTNLDQVPEYGAMAIVTFAKPKGGSGFPARVFAILP